MYLPMLAQSGSGMPPLAAGWVHEVKWDGVRCVLSFGIDGVRMHSRTGKSMSASYPELAAAAESLESGVVIDGEIVTLDAEGIPSFELLQRRMNLHAAPRVADAVEAVPVTFVVFDLLHRGAPLVDAPLESRRQSLTALELPPGFVLSEAYADPGPLWEFVTQRGIEGVVSKRLGSLYRPGVRSPDWVKSVVFRSVRAAVGGFTSGEGGRSGGFGALVLGLPAEGGLRWIGSVGSGFSESDVRHIRAALDQMTTSESPFEDPASVIGNPTWVTPSLVAVVQYKQWTAAGRLRGPSFKGFTNDGLEDISWESEGPAAPGG